MVYTGTISTETDPTDGELRPGGPQKTSCGCDTATVGALALPY
jgi:hypothetical protein